MQHASPPPASPSDPLAVPLSPSLQALLAREHIAPHQPLVDGRTMTVSALAIALGITAAFVARTLTLLIAFVTNLAFFGRLSLATRSPADHHLGAAVIVVPVLGALCIGVMARYLSSAIRGHGIPEAMERVLAHESRIPARVAWLKPLSAAVSIGTGGPFGAEGPIIATGGALGSLLGQTVTVTARERRTLLAAGAAAGMTATFGSPVSAVLLAIELLLFERSVRSIVPVAVACVSAAIVRVAMLGAAVPFPMPAVAEPGPAALIVYVVLGAAIGVAATYVSRGVFAVEDWFERLPIHWMWWPALGAIVVGVVGYLSPHTLGVGYDNIERIVSGDLAGRALVVLCAAKFVSWIIALGSGTSGGTLAPLFTVGGGLGAALGACVIALAPHAGVDVRIAGVVGMAAMFAGASRAVLTSVVFALETTRQPAVLLPLLGGCTAAFAIASALMRHSIMTLKIARRGVGVPDEYRADSLAIVAARAHANAPFAMLASDSIADARRRAHDAPPEIATFAVRDETGRVVGVLSRSTLCAGDVASEESVSDRLSRAFVTMSARASLRGALAEFTAAPDAEYVVLVDDAQAVVGVLSRAALHGAVPSHA